MKLATFIYEGKETAGVLSPDGKRIYPLSVFGNKFGSINSLNELILRMGEDKSLIEMLKKMPEKPETVGIDFDKTEKCAPIPEPRQDIICLGVNYMEHAKESARFKGENFDGKREYAVYFSKRVNRAVADGGKINLSQSPTDSLDYEAELAVIIGRDARNVKAEAAYKYIFGYTIINDISARDIQQRHKQWYMGKSLSDFCPMGPYIVTADELGINPSLKITSRVNGELRQNSTTDLMIFKPDYVIEELSSYTLLKAGTIISMGTPSGVGMGFSPPKFLKKGDTVVCEVEKIGRLTTYIV